VRIGDPVDPEPGTVRALVHEIARLPVEGRGRVAIVEAAQRLNEDAQNALLKTLEEPPSGAVVILCADEADRLLPTVRSRVAALRLGPVSTRAIEDLLAEHGIEPPLAARLGRLAGGRPGLAIAYAKQPEAVGAREEIARALLDLLAADRGRRLVVIRELLLRAAELVQLDDDPGRPRGAVPQVVSGQLSEPTEDEIAGAADAAGAADVGPPPGRRAGDTPAERRRAARALLETWAQVARDLAVVGAGGRAAVHDPALLDDLDALAPRVAPGAAAAFLERLATLAERLEANANPELVVDVLALAWPRAA
jgi:DNA polymerase-3 subunit delta'